MVASPYLSLVPSHIIMTYHTFSYTRLEGNNEKGKLKPKTFYHVLLNAFHLDLILPDILHPCLGTYSSSIWSRRVYSSPRFQCFPPLKAPMVHLEIYRKLPLNQTETTAGHVQLSSGTISGTVKPQWRLERCNFQTDLGQYREKRWDQERNWRTCNQWRGKYQTPRQIR